DRARSRRVAGGVGCCDHPVVVAGSCASLHPASRRIRRHTHQAPHPSRRDGFDVSRAATMRIEIFIDDEPAPRYTLVPPATLTLDSEGVGGGPHHWRGRALGASGSVGVGESPFTVRNGPGIAVVGLSGGETVRGSVPLVVNASASRPGDVFEPVRAETPAPIPTWAWVLFLVVVAWGMWYVATEFRTYRAQAAVI